MKNTDQHKIILVRTLSLIIMTPFILYFLNLMLSMQPLLIVLYAGLILCGMLKTNKPTKS